MNTSANEPSTPVADARDSLHIAIEAARMAAAGLFERRVAIGADELPERDLPVLVVDGATVAMEVNFNNLGLDVYFAAAAPGEILPRLLAYPLLKEPGWEYDETDGVHLWTAPEHATQAISIELEAHDAGSLVTLTIWP
jgi:hypothetical protein